MGKTSSLSMKMEAYFIVNIVKRVEQVKRTQCLNQLKEVASLRMYGVVPRHGIRLNSCDKSFFFVGVYVAGAPTPC